MKKAMQWLLVIVVTLFMLGLLATWAITGIMFLSDGH
jgi:uncharacterized membrane protein YciS (DUF1049 family)